MTALVTTTSVALFAVAVLLALTTVAIRAVRIRRTRGRAALVAGPRRRLVAFIGDGGVDGADELVALPEPAWRALEPVAIALLSKIRGEARQGLVTVFERRGAADAALRGLSARSAVRRARAAEALGNLGRVDAVPLLCALLDDPYPEVRVVSVRALGRIGDPGAAEPLLAALAVPGGVPSQPVAHALIQIGPAVAPAVVAAVDHQVPLVRVTALDVLGPLGVGTATGAAARALIDDPVPEVRVAAATALGRLGTRPALDPLLAVAAADQPVPLLAAVARALGDLGSPRAVPVLGRLLRDDRFRVAHEAAHALRRLGPAGVAELRRVAGQDPGAARDPGVAESSVPESSVPERGTRVGRDSGQGDSGQREAGSREAGSREAGSRGSAALAHAREALAMAAIGIGAGEGPPRPLTQTLAEAA